MPAIERRSGPFVLQIREVLRPARRKDGREVRGGGIIQVVAPSIGTLGLQTVREAPGQLRGHSVVLRGTPRHEADDIGAVETIGPPRGTGGGPGPDRRKG